MGSRGGMKRYGKTVWPSTTTAPLPRHVPKVGRNDPCPCGSGKKYKDCHIRAGVAFLEKLGREDDKRRLKETRHRLKAQGVPWYRRIFIRHIVDAEGEPRA